MISRLVLYALLFILGPFGITAQQPMDLGKMTIYDNHFYNRILTALGDDPSEGRIDFKAIPSNIDIPGSISEFETVWKNLPVSQGRTGTCWCYSSGSFIESEIYRISGKRIKLSEMYIVYFEYLSKAEAFIDTKGSSNFSEGSEANALTRQMRKHGLVPFEVYEGNAMNKAYHDHAEMVDEMTAILNGFKKRDQWNRKLILNSIEVVLGHYLGHPPEEFMYEGVKHTPMSFMKEIAGIHPDDYIEFMSLKSEPYWSKAEYKVPDNYWHSKEYHNVPLDVFMDIIKSSVKKGFSMAIGGDVSEAGYLASYDVAFVPSFDIPSEYIDENARQFRFSNNSTTDDHGVHLIGYKEIKDGKWWFLIKDSSSSSFNGKHKGYFFYHEDYIKLKMMNITVHRDAVKDVLLKF
jgi:bleomycin hydrolase